MSCAGYLATMDHKFDVSCHEKSSPRADLLLRNFVYTYARRRSRPRFSSPSWPFYLISLLFMNLVSVAVINIAWKNWISKSGQKCHHFYKEFTPFVISSHSHFPHNNFVNFIWPIIEFAPAYYLLASGICLHGDVINLSLGLLSLHWSIKSWTKTSPE